MEHLVLLIWITRSMNIHLFNTHKKKSKKHKNQRLYFLQ